MSEYASREYARSSASSSSDQKSSVWWQDSQMQQALQKLKAERQQSFSFVKVSRDVIEIRIDVSADGDRELYMKFMKNGDKVSVLARYKDQESPQVAFEITPRHPELFFLWHHVTSYGSEPFRLFFSLSPEQRAFLDNYKNLPPELQASLAKEVSANKFNIHEKVTGKGDQAKVSAPNKDSLPYMTPVNLPGLDLQDQLAISCQRDSVDANKATYVFVHNGKQMSTLTTHKFSTARSQANFQPVSPKDKASAGTFEVPFTLSKGIHKNSFEQCSFVFVPTEEGDEVVVAFKLKGGSPWADTFKLKLPYDYNRGINYEVSHAADHLLIDFKVPSGTTLKLPAQIKVYYQVQSQLDESLDPAAPNNDTKQDELQHRVEALHVYTNQAEGKGLAVSYKYYYRKGRLQTKKQEKTTTHLMVEAADHARKHLHADTKERTVKDIYQELTMQEEGYIKQFWTSPEGQNFDWQLRKGEVKDKLSVKGAVLYAAYQDAYLALIKLIPLVGEAKRKEGALQITPKLKFIMTYAQRQLWHFEQYCQTWLKQARRSGIDSLVPLPTMRQNVPQLLGKGKGLEKIDLDTQLEMYHNVMMGMTQYAQIHLIDSGIENTKNKYKAWLDQHKLGDKGSVKAEKNREKDVEDLTKDLPVKQRQETAQVKESRSLRKNFANYVQKEMGNNPDTIVKIPTLYYPETENLKNEIGENKKYAAIGEWLKKNPLVVMDIPVYAYLKGDTWYAVSLVNRAKDKYYHQPYKLTTAEEKQRYKRFPPPALFGSMNEKDHLPPGFLMYQIPGAKGTAPRPVHIKNKMTLDEIMTWIALWGFIGGLVIATGGAATGVMPLLAEAGFAIATIVGGVAGFTSYRRKTKNGTMSQEDKVIAIADMAAALLAIPQWKGLRAVGKVIAGEKVSTKLNGLLQAGAVGSWQGQYFIKVADLMVDSTVIVLLTKQGIDKTVEIMASPGSDDDRSAAVTKLWVMLGAQNLLFVGTLKARWGDISQALKDAGTAAKLRADSKKLKDVDPKNAQNYVEQLKAQGIWQVEQWNLEAFNMRPADLQSVAKSLHELSEAEAKALRVLYPQKEFLTQLVHQGDLKTTRQMLDSKYNVNKQMHEEVKKLFTQQRWHLDTLLLDHAQFTSKEVYALARRLNGMDDTAIKVTKDMYGEENLMQMLYVHRGNYKKATDELNAMYGIDPKVADKLRHAEKNTYDIVVKPAEDEWNNKFDTSYIAEQRVKAAQTDLQKREQYKEAMMSDKKWEAQQEKSYQKQITDTQKEIKSLNNEIKRIEERIIVATNGIDMVASPHGIKMELQMASNQLRDTRDLMRQTREQVEIKRKELENHDKAYEAARKAYTDQFWKNNKAMKKYQKLKAQGKALSPMQEKRMKITLKNRERQLARQLANPKTELIQGEKTVADFTNNIANTKAEIKELGAKAKNLAKQAKNLQGRLDTAKIVDQLNWGEGGLVGLHQRKNFAEKSLPHQQEGLQKAQAKKRAYNRRLSKEVVPGINKSREDLAIAQNQQKIADRKTQSAHHKFTQDKKRWEAEQHQAHLLREQLKLKQEGKRLNEAQAKEAIDMARTLEKVSHWRRVLNVLNADFAKGVWSLLRTIISLMSFPNRYTGDYDQRDDLKHQVNQAVDLLQAELKALNFAKNSGIALPPDVQKRYAQALKLSKDLSQQLVSHPSSATKHQALKKVFEKVQQCLQRMQLNEQIWEALEKEKK